MSAPKILLIEGRRVGEDSLKPALLKDGLDVYVCHTASEALKWAEQHVPALIVFDASSMRSNGVRSCRRLRKTLPDSPLIHTRVNGEAKDTSAEADFYLMKPYTPRKVLNRVRALLPADELKEEIVRAGELTLYRSKPSVDIGGRGEKPLTPKQARLLEEFLRFPNQVLSRRQLMQNVWQTNYIGDTRTLDVHIRWVREAIEDDPAKPQRLTTVRGEGYIFHLPSPA